MRTLCAIRTYRWTAEEQRLADALRPVFGDDLAVAFHNRPDGVDPGIKVADFDDDWVTGHGLRAWPDYGWRCGDYGYYALREAFPDYDYYWLIEPDVYFTGDPAGFFGCFDGVQDDLLGYDIVQAPQDHAYAGTLRAPFHRAIFAMTRLSGRALDALLPLRVENCAQPIHDRGAANDELFVFGSVAAHPNLSMGHLEDHAAAWFEGAQFDTDPDMIRDLADQIAQGQPRVFHPVGGRAAFIQALSARVTKPRAGAMPMAASIAMLTDEELETIGRDAHDRAVASLHGVRKRHRMRTARQRKMAQLAQEQD